MRGLWGGTHFASTCPFGATQQFAFADLKARRLNPLPCFVALQVHADMAEPLGWNADSQAGLDVVMARALEHERIRKLNWGNLRLNLAQAATGFQEVRGKLGTGKIALLAIDTFTEGMHKSRDKDARQKEQGSASAGMLPALSQPQSRRGSVASEASDVRVSRPPRQLRPLRGSASTPHLEDHFPGPDSLARPPTRELLLKLRDNLEQHATSSIVDSDAVTWLTLETPSQSRFSTASPSQGREHRGHRRRRASPSTGTIKSSTPSTMSKAVSVGSLPSVQVGTTTSTTFRLTGRSPSISEVAEYRTAYLGPKAKDPERRSKGRMTPMTPEERRHDRSIAQMRAQLAEDLKWLERTSDAFAAAPLRASPPRRARRRRQSPGSR